MINGKNIVVTGASSGIGFETVKLLMKGQHNKILAVARHVDSLVGLSKNVIPFACDVSSTEGVEKVFEQAEALFDRIDIFYANAGFPYYEEFNYTDWERVEKMFNTNTLSPMYTYSRYLKHLDGRSGQLAFTVSAIGQMAMPGYAVYSASKFALHGFQQGIRLEMPKNLTLTCLYPVATDTNFFKVAADGREFEKPFPVQKPAHVAKKFVAGLESGQPFVFPCGLFTFAKALMSVVPSVRTMYWGWETAKFERYKQKLKSTEEHVMEGLKEVKELGQEIGQTAKEVIIKQKEKFHGV